jgi:hypothetical protein
MVLVVRPITGAMRMIVGLLVVTHPRVVPVATTLTRPMLRQVMPTMVQMRVASIVICRRM